MGCNLKKRLLCELRSFIFKTQLFVNRLPQKASFFLYFSNKSMQSAKIDVFLFRYL